MSIGEILYRAREIVYELQALFSRVRQDRLASHLVKLLFNKDIIYRLGTVKALFNLDLLTPKVIDRVILCLTELLQSQQPGIRAEAAILLFKLGERAWPAAPDLLSALDDENEEVRLWSTFALGKIGKFNPQIMERLSRQAEDCSFARVRDASRWAMAKILLGEYTL